MDAAELHQEGVEHVWEEVQQPFVLVHLFYEQVDGTEGLLRERQEALSAHTDTQVPERALGPVFPTAHHQRVHRGQAPDVGLGLGGLFGGEAHLQASHQPSEHDVGKGCILYHRQPHLLQVATRDRGQHCGLPVICTRNPEKGFGKS